MRKIKKKILIILRHLPYPLDSGGNQALYYGIISIKDTMDIVVTYEDLDGKNEDNRLHMLEMLNGEVEICPFVYRRNLFDKTLQLFRKAIVKIINRNDKSEDINIFNRLYQIERYQNGFIDHINDIICTKDVDIVQIEMIWMASLVASLPSNVKKVFIHHEIGFVRHELELINYGSNNARKAACIIGKQIEITLLNMFDAVITLSSIDSQKLINNGVKVPVYDSFAVVQERSKSRLVYNASKILSFLGPESSPPNVIGLEYFLEKSWIALLKHDPNYKLQIIGNWSVSRQNKIIKHYPNVSFLGFVDDLESCLKNTIFIVPITIGSGIRMKILEAASIGVPIVTTSVGVEGIPFSNKIDCLIADNPESFTSAILELNDVSLCNSLIQNAHSFVKNKYSIESLANNRSFIYNKILGI